MADTTDDLVVTIEPEKAPEITPANGTTGAPVVVADPAAADLAAQLEALRATTAADREGKQAADRRARQAEDDARRAREEVKTARGEAADSQLETITAGIDAAKSEASAAETAYAAAMEAGNFADAAKHQRRMASAEAKIVRLDEAKDYLSTRKAVPQADDVARQQPQSKDPFEAYLANRTAPTADWLRSHRDWVEDPKKNAKLTSAHWAAVADGLTADTAEYFEAVEKTIGLRTSDAAKPAPTNGAKRNGSGHVAPVSYTGGGTNGAGNEVRLSRQEALAATDGTHIHNFDDPSPQKKFKRGDPIGVQEFARRKQAMMAQGLYDKSFVES